MTDTIETDTDILEAALRRMFTDQSTPEARQEAEDRGWMPELWKLLADGGLAWIGAPESIGGPGGSLADVAVLLRLAGTSAAALPLAESSGLLGGWLAGRAGLALPDGPISVPVPRAADVLELDGASLSGRLHRVPWARCVHAVAAIANSAEGPKVVLIDPGRGEVEDGRNLAGEPRDQITFDRVEVSGDQIAPVPGDVVEELQLRGALSRTLLMVGALEAVAALTVRYTGERHQFGRPIARFQAVAQRLARLACETEAASLAAEVACQRLETSGHSARFEVAAAKVTVGRAATEVTAGAHQIHGAIGMSQEYELHHFTRRLWSWRQEWGSEVQWARSLGRQVVAAGPDALWPRIADGDTGGGTPGDVVTEQSN